MKNLLFIIMNIFKSYTYKWWQVAIFKLALLALGITIGAFWHSFFGNYLTVLLVIAIICAVYILTVSFKKES